MNKSTVLCAGCVAIALMAFGNRTDAAQPSAERMRQMGLSGAQVVSDSVAMNVRGHGYSGGSRVQIWGKSSVRINGLRVRDSYNTTTNGSQADSTFVALPVGGIIPFAGGGSFVKVARP